MPPERVAVLWVHFGPYHLARLRALRRRCKVTAIEFASGQQIYKWQSDSNSEVLTLGEAVYEHAGSFKTVLRLWRVLNESSPEVLFIPGYRERLALVAALWGKLHRRTNVLMFDSTAFDAARSPWKEKLKAVLAQWLYQRAFVSGQRSALYLQSLLGQAFPSEPGYDVVDNTYFASRVSEIRTVHHQDLPSSPFLFVGRLAPVKNLPTLIDAFGRYKRQGGKRNLDIVGHGPLEAILKAAATQAGLGESIRFADFQSYDSLPQWYAQAACLILPSVSEPWGLVVNEAMASGLPVIVSDRCGCVDDLVEHGRNGYVFCAESSGALAERMLALDALGEADLRAMGHRSQEIIARYAPGTWADAAVRLIVGNPARTAVA